MSQAKEKKIYFTAGPAPLPAEVKEAAHKEFLNYQNCDISVYEMSHRSQDFKKIIGDTEASLRELLKVPDNYSVLFMHGGAKTQFDSIPMNLCCQLNKCQADYIVNGSWSKMAADEASKYVKVERQTFDKVPKPKELKTEPNACYRYWCDNETIQGIEWNYVPEVGKTPLVADMTSNFLSKPIDVSKFGIIFAGAQKNCGIAGLCIVLIRNDLIGKQMPITPTIQSYKVTKENNSCYNTPPTFAIYMAGLCFKWMLSKGGLEAMDEFSKAKSNLLYHTIDNSQGFYISPVACENRSRTNVVFLLKNKELEAKFLVESKKAGLFELNGHRSVGGFRASLYHGITLDDVKRLVAFLNKFQSENSSS